jgi:hypothetical protein
VSYSVPADHPFILAPNVSRPILILSYHTQRFQPISSPQFSEIKSMTNHTVQLEIYNLPTFTSIQLIRLLNQLRHTWHATARPTFVHLSLKHIKLYAKDFLLILPTHPPTYPPTDLPTDLHTYRPTHLPNHPPTYLSICGSIALCWALAAIQFLNTVHSR